MPDTGHDAESRERERCRREAQNGPCPVCGRSAVAGLERQITSYAQGNTRLHARVAELESQVGVAVPDNGPYVDLRSFRRKQG